MYKNILVPVMLDDPEALNAALDVAQRISRDGAPISVLHVIESVPGYVDAYLPEDYRETRRAEAEVALKAALVDTRNARPTVVFGHPGTTIVDHAAEHDVDCIVIASHRPGLKDYFLGSTAARVVRHAQCAVHVIR